MKKYLFIAASALALASCSSEDFVGTEGGNVENGANKAINFGGGTGKITRANLSGEPAAKALGKHFVVFGDKTGADDKTQSVYDHYDVQWKGTDATSLTQSNQKGWEYVGYTPNKNSGLENDATQSIKYWDYSAKEYNFAAFSLGKKTGVTDPYENQIKFDEEGTITDGKVKISKISDKATSYTVEGNVSDIAELYISDRITAKPSGASSPDINYQNDVQFNFRALKTLVRMGIFETVPGYSVKDVNFYSSTNTTSAQASTTPGLYATETTIPDGNGKATITFGAKNAKDGSYNKALVAWNSNDNKKDITFETLKLKGAEFNEEAKDQYIGRVSSDASLPANYKTVIPSTQIGALTLKVDYTLVSTDGSGETIKVTGAEATVPSEYTQWQPNYSYTYIFKISDKTNGSTGTKPDDPKGLYPIVFDAVVTETEEGIQNTITTVQDVAITTYANGNEIGNEYKKTDNIYACVIDKATGKTANLYNDTDNGDGTHTYAYHANLYKLSATTTGSTVESLTEAEAEAILKTANNSLGGKKLTETVTRTPGTRDSRFVTKIDAADTANGVDIAGNFFKFKVEAGIYVFEYKTTSATAYKVIKVVE